MTQIAVPRQAIAAAARSLAHAARWQDAAALLAAAPPEDPVLALTAAQVAIEADWFAGTATATDPLATATRLATGLDDAGRWDLAFAQLRHWYRTALTAIGPEVTVDEVRRRAAELSGSAPDTVRRGWAEMYRGLIADNLLGESDTAPAHYTAALAAGTGDPSAAGDGDPLAFEAGDPLLAREALRHLGGHDHDRGDHVSAGDRWRRATELGAAGGNVPGTLSQQLLLALLARTTGDEQGAVTLAGEIARWASAIGATSLAAQAAAFIAGVEPTAPPPGTAQDTAAAAPAAAAGPPATAGPRPATTAPVAATGALPPGAAVPLGDAASAVAVPFMTAPLATTPRQ
ncbi:hypothetical protein Daura_15495 [Dactylosporangium aurantiacum]|uniref:Uncharacterized protein n=1 Tax=Dactylosporangium aurantiacum TaxID=35754 RepID=A0A9Q9IR13_9ACTN|nr:hypothetical protein [Dactylosporangium aurantiacum]MDG6107789.1 hypothetical protein [Dactylosporangium aurantiacum]UWZ57433.1 hypothetical protein Daura_15495 [Dactylosporangium aurantiacum]